MTWGQGHDTPSGYGLKLCKICRSNVVVGSHGPNTECMLCVDYDRDLGYMIFGQGQDTHLDHGHQLYEILSILDKKFSKILFAEGIKILAASTTSTLPFINK